MYVWTLKDHPHRVIGECRGFEVRLYHDDTWPVPYMVSTVDQAAGHEMLAALDGASSFMQEH